MRYNNYHKHDHYSNIKTPDTIAKPEHYIDRIKELGHNTYFTTNHGCSGNLFEAYDLCSTNNIKCIFGVEMYYVDDRFDSDRKNYHIVLIAKNYNGYLNINRIISEANKTGYYYKPRIDKELVLTLPPEDVFITTACIHNRINHGEDGIHLFLEPLKEHFKDNFFLEIQGHNHEAQIEWNLEVMRLSKKYDIKVIHGNDSHYIYEEDYRNRLDFIGGKGMDYGEENSFVLDYPEYKTILDRYDVQGAVSKDDVIESIQNTLIFDSCEDLNLKKDIKMPTIYPELSVNERYEKLKNIVVEKLKKKVSDMPKENVKEYVDAVQFELNIIKETNTEEIRTSDYFLINEKIIDIAVNKYGGILTRTGRGSAVSFLVNHLLGFTEVDRLDAEVPLYPTRFMSKSRILETKSLPDIDFNTADPEPFIRASKDVLGDDGCYYMIAYGTLKMSGAFRLLCRRYGIEMEAYNDFGKEISEVEKIKDNQERNKEYDKLTKNEKFGNILKESEKFVGVIDSASPSPCSFLLLEDSISEHIGLTRVNDELCAMIDGYTSDVWKFLKNDILTVTVWKIISECYKELNKPIPSISELRDRLDSSVWKLYEDGITKTLNQVDSEFATPMVKKYSPKNAGELTAFVAAIRPSFSSLLNGFLNREPYSTGTPELDELLSDSFHYLLYQENIMQYLTWLGVEEDQTYGLIKKISKKKLSEKQLEELNKTLSTNWIKHIGDDDKFSETYQVVKDAAKYGFNSSHANSVAWDSIYGAELKAHYPLVYYTVIFNIYKEKTEKIAEITKELDYFNITQKPIKFRYSKSDYTMDSKTNSIYKGIYSLKYLNEKVSNELYELRDNSYDSFLDLLIEVSSKTSINSRQLKILIVLGFFSEFGKSKKLLTTYEYYANIYNRKQIKKSDIEKLNLSYNMVEKFSEKETDKLFKNIYTYQLLKEVEEGIEDKPLNVKERLGYELEYMGYAEFKYDKAPKNMYYVTGFKTYKAKDKPYLELYSIKTGESIKAKITNGNLFSENPFKEGFLLAVELSKKPKNKIVDGKWKKSKTEFDNIIDSYEIY